MELLAVAPALSDKPEDEAYMSALAEVIIEKENENPTGFFPDVDQQWNEFVTYYMPSVSTTESQPENMEHTAYIIICAICISVCLHYANITPTLYGTISQSIGIYRETMSPFLSILWEQIFAGDLFWSILVSLMIVFFDFKCLININKCGSSENAK